MGPVSGAEPAEVRPPSRRLPPLPGTRHAGPPSLARIGALVLASAVLPGSAHLAAGHRRWGRVLLGLAVLVLAGLLALGVWAWASPADAASLAVRPDWLRVLEFGVPVLAAVWIGVIVRSATLTRPGRRGTAGRLVAGGVAAVLVAAVALPAGLVARYAAVQRGLVQDVFGERPLAQSGGPGQDALDPRLRDRLNVLLVGSDAGPDRRGVRTDSIILASLDTRTGRTVLFTLPRNLEQVPFAPGSIMARQFPRGFSCGDACLLNGVYGWAADRPELFPGDPEPGMTALRSAVSGALALPVDYFALVDLAGFEALVDALGGVTIRVERRLPIGGLDADGDRVRPSGYVEAGLQRMDGETALAYARSRADSSDYERVQRQRCLLGAIQRQADPGTLVTRFQRLASSTAAALRTDLPRDLLPDLVQLAFRVKERPIESLTFTPPLVDVVEPDFDAIQAAVREALSPTRPAPAPAPAAPAPAAPAPAAPAPSSPAPSGSPGPTPTATPTGPPDPTPVSVEQVCAYS